MVFEIYDQNGNPVDISDFIAFRGLKRGRNDIDSPEAGRTLDGAMHRGRVASKIRWDVTCRPLTSAELSVLEALIMPEYIRCRIPDPHYGTSVKTYYSNNTAAAFLIRKKDGTEWWDGITFPIIEV